MDPWRGPSGPTVTDGGLETDLIFHHGVDLPAFAAFPLLEDERGCELLEGYYRGYAEVALATGAALLLETPTWRANSDWGAQLGWGAADLDRVNRAAVSWLSAFGTRYADRLPEVRVGGTIGPRGDGYVAGAAVDPDEATAYHRPQLESFAAAGADLASAYTLTGTGEAVGIVRAAREVGLPVAISFTLETDGRLPDGTVLADAVAQVDDVAAPDYYLLNCAHPLHIAPALQDRGAWRERIRGLRCNASTATHAELDAAEELDEGDLERFTTDHADLLASLPQVVILGGCCGTDVRHVARLWGTSSQS
ncbi:homocysteine S-methyltransferase family protein [uncultured Friedmanniella sp.]|uniref:homocysteine S-methyltransferase family protein n=1 Tax=uncultured Friedmanniella sp. TaxID=335381 RepID=UPI0035C94B71